MPPLQLRCGKWSGGWGVMVVNHLKGSTAIHLPGQSFVWMLDGSGWWKQGETVKYYTNKEGAHKYVGTKQLRESETLDSETYEDFLNQLSSECRVFFGSCVQLPNCGSRVWSVSSMGWGFASPRRYPEPFGEAVARIHQDLAHVGPCRFPPTPQPFALEILCSGSLSSEADSLFANAKLGDAVEYLLKGKHLQLPRHWQDYFSSV